MAIYAKLLEFQKQGITITKDATNPHFRSSYSSLNEVLDKVKKPLNDLGVLILQKPNAEGLHTTLLDAEDGSHADCFVPFIGAADMQKLGGAITYARRYSLVTLLGLEDEDDDGNAASAPKAPSRAAQRPTAPAKGTVEQEGEPFPSEAAADDFSLESLETLEY